MQPIFLLKNSGNTRFDHGAHGACFMISRSTFAHCLFTEGVSVGARLSFSISLFVLRLRVVLEPSRPARLRLGVDVSDRLVVARPRQEVQLRLEADRVEVARVQ